MGQVQGLVDTLSTCLDIEKILVSVLGWGHFNEQVDSLMVVVIDGVMDNLDNLSRTVEPVKLQT